MAIQDSAYDALDMGQRGIEYFFEDEIKIGRYIMSGGKGPAPTASNYIWAAVNLVGIGFAGKVGKLGWRVLTKKPIEFGAKMIPFGAKEFGVTTAAMGYGMLTGRIKDEPGYTEAFWKPSGAAPMYVWGGIKETAEALTKPIGPALKAGYLDLAESGLMSAREKRDELYTFFNEVAALTPTTAIVGKLALKDLDRTIANYQKKLDYAKYILPNIKHQQEQIEDENILKAANLRALDGTIRDLNKVNTIEQRLLKARFRTSAEIGGIKVGSELSAMESIWGQKMDIMIIERAMLVREDPYADYNTMVSTGKLKSKGARLQLAKLNLTMVNAGKGTESKDRAMVALQQAQAHEQLRTAQATLGIETEQQKVESEDTLAQALEKQQLMFQVSQIDFQLAYTMQHELVMFAHAKHIETSTEQPKTLQAVRDKLNDLWSTQSTIESSITDYSGKVKTNEKAAAGYARQLVELEKEYIDPLEVSMTELNNIIRMM